MNTLIQKASHHPNKAMILLIKSPNHHVISSSSLSSNTNKTISQIFGVFSEIMIKINEQDKFYGSSHTFLFTLEPEERAFLASGANQSFISCQRSKLQFGMGENGPGLCIKEDMSGESNYSDTFMNHPLQGDTNNK